MTSLADIRENLTGAWDLMNGRVEGLNRLDCSIEGFWRSFGAIILVIPMAFIAMRSEYLLTIGAGNDPPAIGPFVTLRAYALVLNWVAFPLIFAILARPLGLASAYVPFIVARNWATVLMTFFVATPDLFFVLGFLTPEFLVIFQLGLICLIIWFSFQIARKVLAVSAAIAIPVVVLELLLGFVIAAGLARLA